MMSRLSLDLEACEIRLLKKKIKEGDELIWRLQMLKQAKKSQK
jgi:hypothetical protein